MLISKLNTKNFRSLRDVSLSFGLHNALIGPNGAGKSCILHAIKWFYEIAPKATDEDFFNRNTDEPIEIEIVFTDLTADERELFGSYMEGNEFRVKKRIEFDGGNTNPTYRGIQQQIPEFVEVRKKDGKREQRAAFNELVDAGIYKGLNKVRSAEEAENAMKAFEASRPDLCEPIEKTVQLIASRNIGGGHLDDHTKPVFVPAVHEVSEEVGGKRGAVDQLIDLIVLPRIEIREDVSAFRSEFDKRAREVFSNDNLGDEISFLGDSISKQLRQFAPDAAIELVWGDLDLPRVDSPPVNAFVTEGGHRGKSMVNMGHGLQRALIITLLQYLAAPSVSASMNEEHVDEIEATDESDEGMVVRDAIGDQSKKPDVILLIEEPELYLHPARCRHLSNVLRALVAAESESASKPNTQVIFATHSPHFVDIENFEDVVIVTKRKMNVNGLSETVCTRYSWDDLSVKLNTIVEGTKCLSPQSAKARAIAVMKNLVNEGFFAQSIVLVEGGSDAAVLWEVQNILRLRWSERSIDIIPVDGKNNIDRPVCIFEGLGIPTYFVFDGDAKYRNSNKEQERINTATKNRTYLSLGGVDPVDFPETRAYERFAVFEYCLEKTLKNDLGNEDYIRLQRAAADVHHHPTPSDALKRAACVATFVQLTYEEGLTLPTIEKMLKVADEYFTKSA